MQHLPSYASTLERWCVPTSQQLHPSPLRFLFLFLAWISLRWDEFSHHLGDYDATLSNIPLNTVTEFIQYTSLNHWCYWPGSENPSSTPTLSGLRNGYEGELDGWIRIMEANYVISMILVFRTPAENIGLTKSIINTWAYVVGRRTSRVTIRT